MSDSLDIRSLTTLAAEAASRDDAAAATGLLRQALDFQVASLGPHHFDLAPTLNNLAMMLERLGETGEAERCYRRAYAIARRGARPNDPIVELSRANLAAFLQATGRESTGLDAQPWGELDIGQTRDHAISPAPEPASPAPQPFTPPAPESKPASQPVQKSAPPPRRQTPAARSRVDVPSRSPRPATFLAVSLTVAAVVAAWFLLASSSDRPAATPASPSSPASMPAGTAGSMPDSRPPSAVSSAPAREEPPPRPPPAPAPPAAAAAESRPRPSAAEETALAADASLCEALRRTTAAWRCDPLRADARIDAVYYYTRVKTPRDIEVRHRWTHDGRVVRTVNLQVRANPQSGFRTYSRQVVGRQAGQWEVALLGPSGAVLDTQQFRVP